MLSRHARRNVTDGSTVLLLSRVQSLLVSGDLDAAMDELTKLSPDIQQDMRIWKEVLFFHLLLSWFLLLTG